jgi:hypothetical protein
MTSPTETAPVERPDDQPEGYDPAAVERKWQRRWQERGTNRVDLAGGERPFYQLMMFPYPSAEGLHVGNLFAFTGADIQGRFLRQQGHTVFEPLGFDAFGIHSENFALKVGAHPMELTPKNVANFRRQLERTGLMIDWRYASTPAARTTTSGRSGSSCGCSSAGSRTRSGRPSTGARRTRPCSPTSRSSAGRASGAARRSSSGSWSSGSSASASTPSGCSPT